MIMKKNASKIILLFFVQLLASCSGILDKGPLDKFTSKEVWDSPELAQSFLYSTLNSASSYLILHDNWSDNDVILNAGNATFNKEQITSYYDAGWNVYSQIRKCNLLLEQMQVNTSFLESDRKYLIAQAKALRAMIYFSRARLFGKLMIVDRVIDQNENMEFPRTNTIKETYDFILRDLNDAVVDLPITLPNQQGMITRGVVYALIAEVALHGAAYIEDGQDDYYAMAKKASEDLFALGVYELDSDYGKMFNDFNYAMNSKEIIFAQWRHETNTTFDQTWMQTLVPNVNNDKLHEFAKPALKDDFAGWIEMFPSSDLVSEYQVTDDDGLVKDWDQTSYYKNYLSRGGYVSNAIYKNRDNRFYETIVYDSTKYFNSIVTMRDKGNLHWNSRISGFSGLSLTGYIYRKGVYTNKPLWYSDPTYYHYVILRLGRSYLNYAEIMLRLGNVEKAIQFINKTRVVHGGLSELPLDLSLEEAWNAYKRERRVELVHEGDRYWSLLRWGKAEGKESVDELKKVHTSISISDDGKSFEMIPLPYFSSENERVFTKKRYLLPVPQEERVNNPSLDQNEGW